VGHQAGLEAMRRMIRAAKHHSIDVLTFFAFSSENWNRPHDEVAFLMSLPIRFVEQDLAELMLNNVRVLHSGRRDNIPAATLEAVDRAVAETANNTAQTVNLAFNYGGQAEIVDAIRKLAEEISSGSLSSEELHKIDEEAISQRLYHPDLTKPDLIVRSSGELRLSNFLLWQGAYSELYFSDKLWPDFTPEDLAEIIANYSKRERRYGGVS
jgi:undecaprenyl diphosphate synthase